MDSWRQTRQLAFVVFKANDTKGTTIEQFWPMDEVKQVPRLSRKKNFKELVEKFRWRQTQP